MLHHPVDEGHPGGGVVELDVAGEGGVAGEDDRRCVDREDAERRGQRPAARAAPPHMDRPGRRRRAPRAPRPGSRAMPSPPRGEDPRDDDEDGEPRRREQGAGQSPPDAGLEQQAATEAERHQQEREQQPGDEHRHLSPPAGSRRRGSALTPPRTLGRRPRSAVQCRGRRGRRCPWRSG